MAIVTFVNRRGLREGIRNLDLDNNFNYLDTKVIVHPPAAGPGVAVAGGKITSNGTAGAQSITNTFGIAACSISASKFLLTLTNQILTADNMVITLGAGTSLVAVVAEWEYVWSDQFNVVLVDPATLNLLTASGVYFGFSVYNAGL